VTTGEAGGVVQRVPRTPNTVLRGIRESERHESQSEFAEAMAQIARGMGVEAYPDWKYVQRLESGHITWPHRTYRNIIEQLCGRPARELGFAPSARSAGDSAGVWGEASNGANAELREAVWQSGMEVSEFARKVGVHLKTAERWITRGVIPQPFRRWKTSLILGIDESELWPETVLIQEFPENAPGGGGKCPEDDSATIISPSVIVFDEGDVERREFFKVLAGMAATAPVIGEINRPRREFEEVLNAPTSSYDVGEWERVASEYASEVGRVPPIRVIPDLLADLEEAQLRLKSSPDNLRLPMTRVCAQLSALTAIALMNIGDFKNAGRYWRTATRAADQADDRDLRTLIRGRRAVFALYDGRSSLTSILALAGDAISIGDGTPSAGLASGYAARAQTLALLGQHQESALAVHQLADVFSHIPDQTASDRISQWGWSEQRLRHVESYVYSYAGRFNDAAKAQETALALYPKDGYQGRTQVELYKSICIIRGGDPTEGARHAVRTFQALPSSYQNDAVVRRTATLMLKSVPDDAAGLSAISEARELLALPKGSSS
jgi:tetratricopeptide (TPR) repeat protein